VQYIENLYMLFTEDLYSTQLAQHSPSRLKHNTKNAIFGIMAACAASVGDQVALSTAAEH